MSIPINPADRPEIFHEGPCHDDCAHFHALVKELISDMLEPRLIVTVTNAGIMKYASMLGPDRTVELLRDLANVIERTGRRQYQAAMN